MCPHSPARPQDSLKAREVRFESDAARLAEVDLPYAHAIAAEVSRKLPHVLERKEIQIARWITVYGAFAYITSNRT